MQLLLLESGEKRKADKHLKDDMEIFIMWNLTGITFSVWNM